MSLNKPRASKPLNMSEMRVKDKAPMLSRPNSPDRKFIAALSDIPEATPGPNAFAQQAIRVDRHRLEGNAFYQQEIHKRFGTPPTAVHPALRMRRSNSDPPTPPRVFSSGTMGSFVSAHGQGEQRSSPMKQTPLPLSKEGASNSPNQQATLCNVKATFPARDFAGSLAAVDKRPQHAGQASSEQSLPKTPKKRGFLEKLKVTANIGRPSPSMSSLRSPGDLDLSESAPLKAQVVLGTSPSKGSPSKIRSFQASTTSRTSVPRSPSKRRGLFSRKSENPSEIDTTSGSRPNTAASTEQALPSASTVVHTPQTAISDPTNYSYQGNCITSQTHSEAGKVSDKLENKCTVIRSQSLKHFDHARPPTPPAKNTPPEERARRLALAEQEPSRVPFHGDDSSPMKAHDGFVSTADKVSPTKFGSYAHHREMPMLVTQPSMYSLHASVVPNLTDASTFDDLKARFDPLALEGFSLPPENTRTPKQVYTPSMYSTDWVARTNGALTMATPVLGSMDRLSEVPSAHSKQSSSSGSVPIVYPDLLKDSSYTGPRPMAKIDNSTCQRRSLGQGRDDARQPWHGRTHSRDHGNSPRHSLDSTIFAHHVDDELNGHSYASPCSFSHPSAAPSPLQYLPATVYTPPVRRDSKNPLDSKLATHKEQNNGCEDGLGIRTPTQAVSQLSNRGNNASKNSLCLPAEPMILSPPTRTWRIENDTHTNVDPKKATPTDKSPSSDKLDRMLALLNNLELRNQDLHSMRAEMRVSTARLDKRLAAVEDSQRTGSPSPAPSLTSDESSITGGLAQRLEQLRISSGGALDFYRQASPARGHGEDCRKTEVEQEERGEGVTIAELKETNRRLLKMVGGFAEKIEALERKMPVREH